MCGAGVSHKYVSWAHESMKFCFRQVCIFKELRKALSFLQATYHSLSISELDSSHCESWCSLSFLTSCSVAYSRVRKRFRLCKGIELPVNTFSSWQLQWWSQLWVEYPAWNLKGRCTCTFITFRDGNDSLAIGKYLADSGCRNMFRLSNVQSQYLLTDS